MFMFNAQGDKATVVPDQVAALKAAGWTDEPPTEKKTHSTKSEEVVNDAGPSATETGTDEGTPESTDDETGDVALTKKPGIVLRKQGIKQK